MTRYEVLHPAVNVRLEWVVGPGAGSLECIAWLAEPVSYRFPVVRTLLLETVLVRTQFY
jgi:hypothetical protein